MVKIVRPCLNKEKSEGRTVYPAKTKVKGVKFNFGLFFFQVVDVYLEGNKG